MVSKIWCGLLLIFLARLFVFFLSTEQRQNGEVVVMEGLLDREPYFANGKQQLFVDGISVRPKQWVAFNYGDRLRVRGVVDCLSSFRCMRFRLDHSEVELLASDQMKSFVVFGGVLRGKIGQVYSGGLPAKEANLLAGIVLGNLEMDRSFRQELANVGLTHIVAASGMNVTLFVGFMLAIFTQFHWDKRLLVGVSLFAIIMYSNIAGWQPAIVRASLMSGLAMIGSVSGRKYAGLVGLIVSAYLMLWVSPLLVFNFAFLLTFSSMMGQLIISNLEFHLPIFFKALVGILLQNLAAIVFTLPIVLIGFSRFSLISMVTNFLVIWTVEPLMILGLVAGIVGLVWLELAKLILLPAGVLLNYFLWVVRTFADERFLLRVQDFNLIIGLGYYMVLFGIVYYFGQARGKVWSRI